MIFDLSHCLNDIHVYGIVDVANRCPEETIRSLVALTGGQQGNGFDLPTPSDEMREVLFRSRYF
jgi:hypothetical protein